MTPVQEYKWKNMGKILHMGVAEYFPRNQSGLNPSPDLKQPTKEVLDYRLLEKKTRNSLNCKLLSMFKDLKR